MDTRPDEDVRFVIQRELSLLQPDVRASTGQVEALLHPDFCEVAASGRRFDRREVIATLAHRAPQAPDGRAHRAPQAPGHAARPAAAGSAAAGPAVAEPATVSGLTGIRLSGTVILVSYVSEQDGQRSRRSSLWLKTGPSWRLYFHQGTPITAG